MKLHRNRKNKNNMKRFICLALSLCLTFSMGSSYVSAGEMNTPGENTAGQARSLDDLEVVPVQTEGNDGQTTDQNANNIEGTPSDVGQQTPADGAQGSQGDVNIPDAGQQTPSDAGQGAEGSGTAADAGQQATGNQGQQSPTGADQGSQGTTTAPDAGQQTPSGADQGNGNQEPQESQPTTSTEGTQGQKPVDSQPGQNEDSTTNEQGMDSDVDTAEPGLGTDDPNAELNGTEFGAELTEEEMMAIYEELVAFEELPEDEVGSVTYPDLGMGTFSMVAGENWSFDVHYVNQSDPNYVEMTKDFNLKYQMEFHAGIDFAEKDVIIRIPKALFMQRDDVTPVDYSDIAANRVDFIDSTPIPSRSTPFNYYIDGEDIVFFNYKEIKAGTNAAWQVLYKNVKLMKLWDESEWSLQATIKVNVPASDGSKKEEEKSPAPLTGKIDSYLKITNADKSTFKDTYKVYTPELYTRKQVGNYIEGGEEAIPVQIKEHFDDYVYMLWSVTVSGTANQPWSLYINENPRVEDGSDPWMEQVGNDGRKPCVVGYKNNTNSTYQMPISIKYTDTDEEGNPKEPEEWYEVGIAENETENWGTRFWVVTAYPKSLMYDDEGKLKNNTLVNNINVDVMGDEWDGRELSQKWTYREYKWDHTGELLDVEKKSDETINDPKHYTGWLELYKTALGQGKDGYGGIPFHTTGFLNSFKLTHNVADSGSAGYGEYILGKAAELTTVDDIMYLRLETAGIKDGDGNVIPSDYILTRDDYYYSSVTITQKDVGFDMWEADDSVAPESLDKYYSIEDNKVVGIKNADGSVTPIATGSEYADDFNQDVYIYAMFAKDENYQPKSGTEDSANDWEPVAQVRWDERDESGKMTYSFKPEQIRREPYRVKVVHKTINYRTTCDIDVEVFIKKNSQVNTIIGYFDQCVADPTNTGITGDSVLQMTMEDLSGVWGAQYTDGRRSAATMQDAGNSGSSFNYGAPVYTMSGMPSLKAESGRLHKDPDNNDIIPYRDRATKLVTGLGKEAHAFKYASELENDALNERGLVDYYLTAYDGYQMYSRDAMNYLMNNKGGIDLKPGRQKVVFYDLLPYGMHFDYNADVVAGQLDNLTGDYYQKEDSYWNKSAVKEVRPEDIIVTENYRETGRTLVEIHLTYNGSDSSFYTNTKKLWMEGWGVRFGAYFDWKDQSVVQEGANVFAFMPDKDDPRYETMDLCGTLAQIAFDDGELPGVNAADQKLYKDLVDPDPNTPGALKGDINGDGNKKADGTDLNRRNVLYAHNVIDDEIATAGMSKIEKRVRASDEEDFNEESAVVKPGEFYTYDIRVKAESAELSNIVIIDRLENAKADRESEDKDYAYENAIWHGTFDSVITTALEQKEIEDQEGTTEQKEITPVIYYRVGDVEDLAVIKQYSQEGTVGSESARGKTVADYLKEEADKYKDEKEIKSDTVGWVTQEVYDKVAAENRPPVKAVAVYLMYTEEKTGKTGPYTLGIGQSVTFQIRMKAPDWDDILAEAKLTGATDEGKLNNYAYNNPYYYATMEAGGKYTDGTPVLKTEGLLPGNTVSVSANPYGSLEVFKEFDASVPATEANTSFRMKLYWQKGTEETAAGGKVYELYKKTAEGTWEKQQKKKTEPDGYFTLCVNEKAVFTDNLPDVEHIQIKEDLEDVFWGEPEEERATKAEADLVKPGTPNITMTNKYRPVLYVEKILDGMPEGVPEEDKVFTFQLRVSEGAGECKPLGGTDYYLVNEDGTIAKTIAGTTVSKENATEANPEGSFQIKGGQKLAFFPGEMGTRYELEELNSDKWICVEENNTKTGAIDKSSTTAKILNYYRFKDIYLTKKLTHWVPDTPGEECTQVFKFQVFKVDSGDQEHPVTTQNAWQLYEADENGKLKLDDDKKPIPVSGSGTSGTLRTDGTFEAACAGKIVKISGLELEQGTRDAIYVIREVESGADYQPENDFCEFVIHDSDESVRGTITNDYLYRPLSVTKMVLYDYSGGGQVEPTTKDFQMKVEVEVNGELKPLANKQYTLKKNGADDGTGQTNEAGEFTLQDGQTATFEKAGKLGQSFTVSEVQDEEFPQIRTGAVYSDSPEPGEENSTKVGETGQYGDPYHGTISGETNEATIINGNGEYLLIRKEYEAADKESEDWMATQNPEHFAVYFYLEVTEEGNDEPIAWPRESDAVQSGTNEYGEEIQYIPVISVKADGTIDKNAKWIKNDWGSQYRILPGETVVIPLENLPNVKSYNLREDGMPKIEEKSGGGAYYLTRQKEPTNGAPYTGNLDTDRLAVICNEVKYVEVKGKTVYKWMDIGSDEVAEGAELVWKLEVYTENGWEPARDVAYLPFYGDGHFGNEILYTDEEDGKIVLKKGYSDGFPYIQFVEENVRPELNLHESNSANGEFDPNLKGKYRLTELQEESSGWGKLAGYGTLDPVDLNTITSGIRLATDGRTSNLYRYGMDISGEEAVAFVNSNHMDTVEIEKQMADGTTSSTDRFTMILKQVVSATAGTDGKMVYSTIPAANVTYQLYSSKTPGVPIEVEGDTEFSVGDGGEIYLRAGQYAKLALPDNTQWIVSEQGRDGYSLKNLTPDQSTSLKKLGDNEMLINPSRREAIPVGLTVTKVKGQDAVNLVPGRKWWRVDQNDSLGKNDFAVTGIYSDGSTKELDSSEFELIPYDNPDVEMKSFIGESGIKPMVVSWGGKKTTAEISVVETAAFNQSMAGYIWTNEKYFVEYSSGYELVSNSGAVFISEYIAEGSNENPESIYCEYRITAIGEDAYHNVDGNKEVTSIEAPYITEVKATAFHMHKNLVSVDLPRVEIIGDGAFGGCTVLEDVNLPKAKDIGDYAFNECSKLKSVELLEVTSIGFSAFEGCNSLVTVNLPVATEIGGRAFYSCSSLESVNLPKAKTIGERAFRGCSKLSSLKLPEATTIGNKAFYFCKGLREVYLPKVAVLGQEAFRGVYDYEIYDQTGVKVQIVITLRDLEGIADSNMFVDAGAWYMNLRIKVMSGATEFLQDCIKNQPLYGGRDNTTVIWEWAD